MQGKTCLTSPAWVCIFFFWASQPMLSKQALSIGGLMNLSDIWSIRIYTIYHIYIDVSIDMYIVDVEFFGDLSSYKYMAYGFQTTRTWSTLKQRWWWLTIQSTEMGSYVLIVFFWGLLITSPNYHFQFYWILMMPGASSSTPIVDTWTSNDRGIIAFPALFASAERWYSLCVSGQCSFNLDL